MENVIYFVVLLIIPCISFSIISLTYSKYKDKNIKKRISGFEIARKLLDNNNLKDLYIVEVKGSLNDHYDFNQNVVRLSTDVYHGENATAVAVAAKIASYAIQDKNNNTFMKFKFMLNPICNFAVYLAYILFILAICLQDFGMLSFVNMIILIVLLFHIVTLPVESNAIKIAKNSLGEIDDLSKEEMESINNVLKITSYTFIMSILTCISNLFNEIIYNLKRRG